MRFAASISSNHDADAAVDELLASIDQRVTRGMIDLVWFFSTAHFEDELPEVVERIGAAFPNAVLLGCTAEGTIANDVELERVPSMSLLAASLPDVKLHPFHLVQAQLKDADTQFDWERLVGVAPESKPLFIAVGDPFRVDIEAFVNQLNKHFPGAPLVGGLASAGLAPEQNRLIVSGEVVREGIAGVALTGQLDVATVVSQGCRPIGKPFVITKGERNVIHELGGRPVLEQLHRVLVKLPEEDEKLARESLFVGRVIDEYKSDFSRGDFLIHNILGVDRRNGSVGIAGHARVGTTVQFHVRDAASADEDLRKMLSKHVGTGVRGAMLFGCNGRGTNMWPKSGHDVGVIRELLGDIPVAGFFCGGEFGPVGGTNFIHGFTASIALFRGDADD